MGQKRIATFDLAEGEGAVSQPAKRAPKKATKAVVHDLPRLTAVKAGKGTGKLADMGEKMLAEEEERQAKLKAHEPGTETETLKPTKKKVQKKERSRRYRLAYSRLDRAKTYSLNEALSLLKKVSLARFDASIDAHLNLTEGELRAEVSFPHAAGKALRVAIADDTLIDRIAQNKIDFDVLLATPVMMPKLATVAKILGPKGLMPNPKAGTITDDPVQKKKDLEGGQRLVKSEAKSPLMHVTIGKLSMKEDALAENLRALVKAVQPHRITKLTLASSMSPGIKVDLSEFKKKS